MKNITIAKITSVYGIKGLVKLVSFTENPKDFVKYSTKLFDIKNKIIDKKIINQIPSKDDNFFVVKIEGINNRNQADLLKNTELFIKRDDLLNAQENEFYYVDLIGMDVFDLAKEKIGKVVAVNDFGAGGVIDIKFDDDSINMIENFSFTDHNFPEVNMKEGFLLLNTLDIVEVNNNA